jgi:tetratricopeptide (TPR) repeat protein
VLGFRLAYFSRHPDCYSNGYSQRPPILRSLMLKKILVFIAVGIGLCTIVLGALFLFGNPEHFISKYQSSETYYVPSPPASLPYVLDGQRGLDLQTWIFIKRIFEEEQFDKLTSIIEGYQKECEGDIRTEYKITMAFDVFFNTSPSYENKLTNWRQAFPHHYAPQLAFAKYYQAKAWESRGTRYAKDTSFEQFSGMETYLTKSIQYLSRAIKFERNLLPAYATYISILNSSSSSSSDDENLMITRALKLFPHSFLIRRSASICVKPRWGGSYRQMENVAREGIHYVRENPNMVFLYGMIYNDQAFHLKEQKRYEEAETAFGNAVSFGDYSVFYRDLASLHYYKLNNFETALDYIQQSIDAFPISAPSYLLKAKIEFSLHNHMIAQLDLETAHKIGGEDENIDSWRTWAAKKLSNDANQLAQRNIEESVGLLDIALEYDPFCARVYSTRAIVKIMQGDDGAALFDARRGTELDPDDIGIMKTLDRILAQKGQWAEIALRWDEFISRNPENPEAYFERAGTYHHMGERQKSFADLNQACTLGHEQACIRLRKEQG